MNKKNKQIGARIKEIRKRLEITQEEFGHLLGRTATVISRYEGGIIPKGRLLEKIAKLGKVSVDWLLTGREAYAEEKVGFVREASSLSEQEKEVVALLRENPEILPLLRKYGALKSEIAELTMEIVLSPKTT